MSKIGLKMDDSSFRVCVALRLGSNICQPHHCTNCGDLVSKLGRHGLSCEKSKARHSRHNQGNDIVRRAFISAGVPCLKGEPEGLSRSDGKQPDGMTLVPWREGRPLIWDFTGRDTIASSYTIKTSKSAGKAAEIAEKQKNTVANNVKSNLSLNIDAIRL